MSKVPRLRSPDSTAAILLEGYEWMGRRRARYHSDIFRGRLLFEPAIFMGGHDAAELFYSAKFLREGAAPKRVLKTLFGVGGVQGLDDRAHHVRKAMFMRQMTHDRITRFLELFDEAWAEGLDRWEPKGEAGEIVLLEEARVVLCRAACRWAGVPDDDASVRRLAKDFGDMVSGFGSLGPPWWKARAGRIDAEEWARDVIERVRAGELSPPRDTAGWIFAFEKDADGEPLSVQIAAVELLNILRPIVAIGRWIAWCALALHDHPEARARLREDDAFVDSFVQEVRRFYPFTPFLGARVRDDFRWRGVKFERGTLVLLDVHGTNHDPRLWERPGDFVADRFLDREPDAFEYMPQGGGTFETGHRCAGEWLTIETMKRAVVWLTREMEYDWPAQDAGYSMSKMPSGPRSGIVLTNVRRAHPEAHVPHAESARGLEDVARAK